MSNRLIERSWVSPITAFTSVMVAVTGLLMLFHVRLPGIKGLHEWMGVAFAVAALLHIVLNWRPLLASLRRRSAAVALVAALGLSGAALLVPADHDHSGGKEHRSPRTDLVESAPAPVAEAISEGRSGQDLAPSHAGKKHGSHRADAVESTRAAVR